MNDATLEATLFWRGSRSGFYRFAVIPIQIILTSIQ